MNLHGLDIDCIKDLAGAIARRASVRREPLCTQRALFGEAALHMLLALDSYTDGPQPPGRYAYYVARNRVIDHVRRMTYYNHRTGERVQIFHTSFETEDPVTFVDKAVYGEIAKEDEGILAFEAAHDHERTMRRLPARDRTVLQARLDGIRQWQTAHHLGVSQVRISQIEQRAKKRYLKLSHEIASLAA